MAQLQQSLRLTQRQTNNLVNRALYTPDTYLIPLLIEGNSLLSSVWVKSMDAGATLTVRYFETTSGNMNEERVDIVSHHVITPGMVLPQYGFTNQLTVTPFHNKPVCEFIVTGGNVYFGVYVTVVDTFASDLDAALKFDGQTGNILTDKGIPIVGIDRSSNEFHFFEFTDGKLRVQAELVGEGANDVQVFQNGSVADVPQAVETEILSYLVPVGKTFRLTRVETSGDNIATFNVLISGVIKGTKRTYFGGELNTSFDFTVGSRGALVATAGQTVKVTVNHSRPWLGNFDSYLVGSLSNA